MPRDLSHATVGLSPHQTSHVAPSSLLADQRTPLFKFQSLAPAFFGSKSLATLWGEESDLIGGTLAIVLLDIYVLGYVYLSPTWLFSNFAEKPEKSQVATLRKR
ncbi:hypothetical protein KTT_11820 [Tengunoibacter tsumagoiensis]|uniref:Uncharacterized protein n=1 Tax=Tengunoibacter tsumagoiensis TaxID=2014871 RepID=A0A401ZWS8_9CHLR|nr:hypothetical protein KTT_11820 [Tengunoibacter tsumagoiensis]